MQDSRLTWDASVCVCECVCVSVRVCVCVEREYTTFVCLISWFGYVK